MKNIQIEKEIIFLVEGESDKAFFEALFKYLEINYVQIFSTQGKQELKNFLSLLKRSPNFTNVTTLIIVQDTDENPASTFQSILNTLRNLDFSIPSKAYQMTKEKPKVGVILLPDENKSGNLESLCLETIKDKPIYKCIEQYMMCLQKEQINLKKLTKSKFYIFLATTDEPDMSFKTFTKKSSLLDFTHFTFEKVIQFIKSNISF